MYTHIVTVISETHIDTHIKSQRNAPHARAIHSTEPSNGDRDCSEYVATAKCRTIHGVSVSSGYGVRKMYLYPNVYNVHVVSIFYSMRYGRICNALMTRSDRRVDCVSSGIHFRLIQIPFFLFW